MTFTDQSTGGPTAWSWSFGDGTAASTERNPTHTYATRGTYAVTLTAANSCGSHALTKTAYVTVSGVARVVSIAWTRPSSSKLRATALVEDELGQPLAGAAVSIRVTRNGALHGDFSGTTGADGRAGITFTATQKGTYTATVTSVTKTGFIWNGVTPPNQYVK